VFQTTVISNVDGTVATGRMGERRRSLKEKYPNARHLKDIDEEINEAAKLQFDMVVTSHTDTGMTLKAEFLQP